jgi:hypothetical protein
VVPGQGQIQIQFGGAGVINKRISIKTANGVKEIEAEENGQKTKIHEDADGIKLEITKQKDGKETTEKFEAKNAEELKKNNPEAHKIYEQYSQQNQVQLRIGPNGLPILPGQAIPLPAMRLPQPRPVLPRPDLNDGVRKAIDQLRDASDRRRAAQISGDEAAMKLATADMEAAQDLLQRSLQERRRPPVDPTLPAEAPPAPAP